MKIGDLVEVPGFHDEAREEMGLGTVIRFTGRLNNRDCFLVLFARTGISWGFYEDELQTATICEKES